MERGKLNGTKRSTNKKKVRQRKRPKTTATTRTFKLYVSWPDFYFIRCLWTLSLRVLGTLLANCLRLVVGNTFPFVAILLILYGLLVMIYGKDFPLKRGRPIFGAVLIYISVLLFFHAFMFRNVSGSQPDILGNTWEFLQSDLKANQVTQNVGAV